MAQDTKAALLHHDRAARPFEHDLTQDVIDRATRLAHTLFGGVEAQVVLVEGDQAWRSCNCGAPSKPSEGVVWMMEHGQPIWSEDATADPLLRDSAYVTGPPFIRFYAGHPIRLHDGRIAGALVVFAAEPRALNEEMVERLGDLAAFVADEWDRARVRNERELHRRESRTAQAVFNAVIRSIPASVVVTDRDFRVLDCSPLCAAAIGSTPEKVIGRTLAEVAPDAVARWGAYFLKVQAGKTIQVEKLSHTMPDGSPAWMTVVMAPWHDGDGRIGGMICCAQDINADRREPRARDPLGTTPDPRARTGRHPRLGDGLFPARTDQGRVGGGLLRHAHDL